MKKTLCLLLALCMLVGLFAACGKDDPAEPLFAERGEVEREPIGDLKPAKDLEAIRTALAEAGRSYDGPDVGDIGWTEGLRLAAAGPVEGDTVAVDDGCLYMLDSYGLIILSIAGAQSEILSYTRVERAGPDWSERLFLTPDRAAVVCTVSAADPEEESWNDSAEVRCILLDTSDKRKPQLLAETAVEGSLVDARLVDDKLCVVTQRSLLTLPENGKELLPALRENGKTLRLEPMDVYLSPDPEKAAFSVVAALRMEDGLVTDAMAFTGGVEGVSGKGRDLYLSRTIWDEELSKPYREEPYSVVDCTMTARTEIRHLRLEKGLRLAGGCVLEGALPDPAALQPLGDGLCAVTGSDSRSFSAYTDEKHGWTNYEARENRRACQLAVLNGELEISGALTRLGGDKGLADSRFAGGAAWLTAAGENGTVHTVDLSDPAAPTPAGDLRVEGECLYLRDFGEGRVLCLSAPADEGGWCLTMFDLSDPAAPKMLDSHRLKQRPAAELSDPGALFSDPDAGLVGFPVAGETGNQYLLVRWTGEAWKEKGTFTLEYVPDNVRAILREGLLYVCTPPGEVCVTDPDTMKVLATVSNAVG